MLALIQLPHVGHPETCMKMCSLVRLGAGACGELFVADTVLGGVMQKVILL